MKTNLLLALSVAVLAASADPAQGLKVALELKPGPDNPRNSEGAFMPLKDGLVMFAYSRYYGNSAHDHASADIAARYSSDRGETWSVQQPSWLRAPCSPASIKRLPTGDLLVVWNDYESRLDPKRKGGHDGRRTPLSVAISRDDGITWQGAHNIEDDPKGHFCYIAIQPLCDGTVLLGYSAYSGLSHARLVKAPLNWFYSQATNN